MRAFVAFACLAAATAVNLRPIIGILTLPNDNAPQFPGLSYFPASYVKWMESAGARVVPIKFTDSQADIKTLVSSLNGVLFTGGGADFVDDNGNLTPFSRSAQTVLNTVIEANKNGVYMPLWATCLGFQLVNFLVAGPNISVVTSGFDSENLTLPLTFSTNGESSRMMTAAGSTIVNILANEPVTMNNHQSGVTPLSYSTNPVLPTFFQVVSTNTDRKGAVFISTMEAYNYPIYISQWHPEKALFEWDSEECINHSYDSIQANGFFNRFLVNEARKNNNAFPSLADETAALIYNYSPVFTGPALGDFEQCYFFN